MSDTLLEVQNLREKKAEEAEEDALMAMIDAMNASEEEKRSGRTDMAGAHSLADAGKAIIAQHTKVLEDGTKLIDWVDPTATMTVQVLLSCLGDRFTFEQADDVQENQEQAQEIRETEEKRLEVTEQRDPSETSEPQIKQKEV